MLTRHLTRHRQCLERALAPMMIVFPSQHIHMQRNARALRPTRKAMLHHLRIQRTHHRGRKIEVADEEWTGGDVEDGAREGFVEGCVGVAEAGDSGAGTQGGGESGTEREEGIFGGVMVVNC